MATVTGILPAQAAAAAASVTTCGAFEPADGTGTGVNVAILTPPAGFVTVTGVATNNVTFNFRQIRGGSVLSTFGTVTLTAGANLVAEVPLVVPVTPVNLAANDVIDVQMVQNGTGLAVAAGVIARTEIN